MDRQTSSRRSGALAQPGASATSRYPIPLLIGDSGRRLKFAVSREIPKGSGQTRRFPPSRLPFPPFFPSFRQK